MAYNANRAAMIKDGKVLFWITKDGEQFLAYNDWLSAVISLSKLQKDKTAKYDMIVLPKAEYASEWNRSTPLTRIKRHK